MYRRRTYAGKARNDRHPGTGLHTEEPAFDVLFAEKHRSSLRAKHQWKRQMKANSSETEARGLGLFQRARMHTLLSLHFFFLYFE